MSNPAEINSPLSDEEQLGSPQLRGAARHRRTEEDVKTPAFHVATVSTRHFSFEAYGLSDESARDAIRRTLIEHAASVIRGGGTVIDGFVDGTMGDVDVHVRAMGEGYRDGECLTGGRSSKR